MNKTDLGLRHFTRIGIDVVYFATIAMDNGIVYYKKNPIMNKITS